MTGFEAKRNKAAFLRQRCGVRHIIVALLSCAYVTSFFSRYDVNEALVAMTNRNSSNSNFPIFNWTATQKSSVMSSYFAGHVISSVAAGEVIRLVGIPVVLYASFMTHALLSAVTPLILWNGSVLLLSVNRALIGFAVGFLAPVSFWISSRWFPPHERNLLFNLIFCGASIGQTLTAPICALLAQSPIGWPSIFYLAAALLFLFCGLWRFFGHYTPEQCTSIILEERAYIEESLPSGIEENPGKNGIPWKSILTSRPVYALFAVEAAQGIILATLCSEVLFIDDVHKMRVSQNGPLTTISTCTPLLFLCVVGIVADQLMSQDILRPIQLRRISTTLAIAGNASSAILLGLLGASLPAVFIFQGLAYAFLSFAPMGFLTNPLDLSPNHSQTIVGLCRAIESIASLLTPYVISAFLTESHDLTNWRTAFSVVAGPAFLCNIVYLIFLEVKVQPWDRTG